MKYTTYHDIRFSKITLGTAQLGMPYGISNFNGKPDEKTSNKILKFSFENGINTFDTAQVYGSSEQIIGNFFSQNDYNDVNIITKISLPLDLEKIDFPTMFKQLLSVSESRLKVDKIPICLLHDPSLLFNDEVMKHFMNLKKDGLVKLIGVSTYSPTDVKKFLELDLDIIQIPINIFDLRLIKSNLLNELDSKKSLVFGRSIFLQGLFFLNSTNIDKSMEHVLPYLSLLDQIAIENNLTKSELAFSFVNDLKQISSMVIGSESINQLHENLNLLSKPHLSSKIFDEILQVFSSVPENVINPSLWNNDHE